MLLRFKSMIAEGKTYSFEKLSVKRNSGVVRTTCHPFRLRFENGSKVVLMDNSNGCPYVLVPISQLVGRTVNTKHLVDLVGVLSGVGKERELEIHGNKTKSRVIELEAGGIHPLLLTHLAFDQRVETSNDFLYNTQRATMQGLTEAMPGQLFVVIGTIKRVINPNNFAYTACKCSRGVEPKSQMLSCEDCEQNLNNLCARYFLRIQAIDETGCVTLVLLDSVARTLFNKTFLEMLQQNQREVALGQLPLDIYRLVNQKFLFKVEKLDPFLDANEHTFIVRNLCLDAYAINEFQKANQSKGFEKDLTTKGDVDIGKGAGLDDVVSSSNMGSHDVNEDSDINICRNLFKTSLQF